MTMQEKANRIAEIVGHINYIDKECDRISDPWATYYLSTYNSRLSLPEEIGREFKRILKEYHTKRKAELQSELQSLMNEA